MGCTPAPGAARADGSAGGAGFLPAPTVVDAGREASGAVRLEGRAPPDALIRLLAPDGRALGVTADAQGRWSAELPGDAEPRMFALSAEAAGRTLRAEGALAVLPPGSVATAVIARAGAAAAAAGVAGGAPLRIAAVDFDAGGGVAASGAAPPGAALRLLVDGAAVGTGQADRSGRFGVLGVGAELALGPHRLRVEGKAGSAEADVDTRAPAPLAAPFRAIREARGWRLDWSPPGGGAQSVFVPDAPTVPAQ